MFPSAVSMDHSTLRRIEDPSSYRLISCLSVNTAMTTTSMTQNLLALLPVRYKGISLLLWTQRLVCYPQFFAHRYAHTFYVFLFTSVRWFIYFRARVVGCFDFMCHGVQCIVAVARYRRVRRVLPVRFTRRSHAVHPLSRCSPVSAGGAGGAHQRHRHRGCGW
jgi:hypothetical protein